MTKIKIPISLPVLTVIQERKLKELLPGQSRLEASGVVVWQGQYIVITCMLSPEGY